MRRIVAAVLLAGLCAPAPVWAEDEPVEASEPSDEAEAEAPAPVEKRWWEPLVHNADIGFDLLIVRPFAGVTAAVGCVLFIPAVIMTAPNGKDSMKDAYERFVREPGEYFASRPLGEF